MATPGRRPDPPLSEQFFAEPYRFGFFQAVRLLAKLRPAGVPVGRTGPLRREVARFRARASLAFPPSELYDLKRPEDPDAPPELTVSFLGLTGPLGVLPHCYTEFLIDRLRRDDRTGASFFDLFNHRLTSLFYRAWEKYRPHLAHERGEPTGEAAYLFDLIGLGAEPLRRRHRFPDEALLFYVGFLSRRHRPAVSLQRLLTDYFRLPIEVLQFQAQWLRIEPESRSRLGAYSGVGRDLVLGAKVRDEQGKFRLRVGPLSLGEFLTYTPDGIDLPILMEMTRFFVDAELAFDVQLILRAEEVPACRLSRDAAPAARLGRHAWLKSRPFARDSADAVYSSDRIAAS